MENMFVFGVCKSGVLIEKKMFNLILYISFCCFNLNKEQSVCIVNIYVLSIKIDI